MKRTKARTLAERFNGRPVHEFRVRVVDEATIGRERIRWETITAHTAADAANAVLADHLRRPDALTPVSVETMGPRGGTVERWGGWSSIVQAGMRRFMASAQLELF